MHLHEREERLACHAHAEQRKTKNITSQERSRILQILQTNVLT